MPLTGLGKLVNSAARASGRRGLCPTNGVRRVFVKVLSPRILFENLLGVERSLYHRFRRLSAAFRVYGPSYHTAGEISGWNSRPRLDKDERNIVRRHRDKLE